MEQETIEIAWLLNDTTLKEKLRLARNPATKTFLAILGSVEDSKPTNTGKSWIFGLGGRGGSSC